jgi:ketosteroid isomerase-like protein
MNRRSTFLAVFCLALAAPLFAQKSSVADHIKKLEQDRAQAVVKGDTAALDRMTSDDYVFTDFTGRTRKKQDTISAIKAGDIKMESYDLDDLDVHVYGNAAVITGKATTKGTIGGQDASGSYRFTRVYVKQAGAWKSVAYQQTKIQ